jgi:hypothetical protein
VDSVSDADGGPRLLRVLGRVDVHGPPDPTEELAVFAGVEDLADVEARLRAEVQREIEAMLDLTHDFDAFDVIDLMRQRELPIVPVLALRPDFDGSAAAIELVALLMLTRGERKPSPKPREDTRPNEAIDELHERSKRLLRLAIHRAKACEFLRGRAPLARLSADYQSYLVGVRALQYESVQSEHERALFCRPEMERLLRTHLGFTYDEFAAVRDAIQGLYSDTVIALRDLTGDIFLTTQAEGRDPTAEEAKILAEAFTDWMFLPAERAAFTATDVAQHGSFEVGLVERILDRFSLDFDASQDATAAVVDFLRAKNPFDHRDLVREHGRHLVVSSPIGGDALRRIVEHTLKNTSDWPRYNATRRDVSESLASSAVERLLGTPALAASIKYFAPRTPSGPETLGEDCNDPTVVGTLVESDALFVVDDVAICLEVKGRAVAESARRGDQARLKTEIKNIIGSGAAQARRLESLIRANGGLWRHDGTWLDLAHVREIHTIVAGLDYFGPLGVALGDLADTNLVGEGALPWIVSIHDLQVIASVVERPAEFLLYLRRRVRSSVAQLFRGADELDLFMLFVDGHLYVEDDPDEVHRRHPRTSAPTRTARKRHARAARPTLVGTFTDPLDAWMYHREATSPYGAEKPAFNVERQTARLVDFLADARRGGWLRVGADLLGLEGRAQRKVNGGVERLAKQTRADGRPHSLSLGFPNLDGFMTFFAATVPAGGDRDLEADQLETYMLAKKHQLASDRSFGVLVGHDGELLATCYMNQPPVEDTELDELGSAIGLHRTWENSERRSSLSEKKRKRRRKRG